VPYAQNRHVGGERPSLTAAQRALVEEANALDLELHAFARSLFEQRVAAETALADAVEALRAATLAEQAAESDDTRAALAWLKRELPPGVTRPLVDLLAAAERDGISRPALGLAAKGYKRKSNDEAGRRVWTGREPD
jgi:hypothetical protein